MKKTLTVLAALGLVLAITGGAFAAQGLLTGATSRTARSPELTSLPIQSEPASSPRPRGSRLQARGALLEPMVSTVPPAWPV